MERAAVHQQVALSYEGTYESGGWEVSYFDWHSVFFCLRDAACPGPRVRTVELSLDAPFSYEELTRAGAVVYGEPLEGGLW